MIIAIEGLEDLTLYFRPPSSLPEHLDLSIMGPTTKACARLLKAVAKHCICLTLSVDLYCFPQTPVWDRLVARLQEEATEWRCRSPFKDPFTAARKRLSISRSRSSHVWANHPHRSSGLRTLILQADALFFPPFSSWAFKVMNTAPITRLDFIEIDLSHTDGHSAHVLGALTLPTLEYLRIISCQIEFGTLANFLSRHGTISTLDMISWVSWPHHPQLPITTLPALVSLTSSQTPLNFLLMARDALEDSFVQTAKRLSATNIRLCLDILTHRYAFRTVSAAVSQTSAPSSQRFPVLSQVREISFSPDVIAPSHAPFRAWLFTFPLLEHIQFANAQVGRNHQTKMSLLRLIAQTCPGIRSVRIGQDTRGALTPVYGTGFPSPINDRKCWNWDFRRELTGDVTGVMTEWEKLVV